MSNPPFTFPFGSMNVLLIGFMGAGKTTVGRLLAERLDYQFVDTDDLVVERAGKPIPRIFAEDGEAQFRQWETEVIRSLQGRAQHVIALGGGAVKRAENLPLLKAVGAIVYLAASPAELARRIHAMPGVRPLIDGDGAKKTLPEVEGRVRELLAERLPLYERAADIVIETTGLTAEQVCQEVVRWLGSARVSAPQSPQSPNPLR
ncbi:MAG: shikimate kinase [Abditibacteriales bacterium]|nr:shikimate kinase [Abditibacteriales bacterium]MDW8367225.1 shikimate kinase [Abditibacteriales bacterium]